MKKIVILNGSPRKNGYTASLIKAFIDGAIESKNEVREQYLHGMNVKPCLGCDVCMKTHNGCIQKDEDMAKIYDDLTWADVIVFASPMFFGTITAQLKTAMDRMWGWFNLPGNVGVKKECAFLMTARGNDYRMSLDQYNIFPMYLGWKDLGTILGRGKEQEAKQLGKSIE